MPSSPPPNKPYMIETCIPRRRVELLVEPNLLADVGVVLLLFVIGSAAVFAVSKSLGLAALQAASPILAFGAAVLAVRPAQVWRSTLIASGIVATSLFVAAMAFDVSWDGMAYHHDSIMRMSSSFQMVDLGPSESLSVLTTHYPKLSWLFGASLMPITDNINTSKSVNLILLFSVALIAFPMTNGLKPWERALCTLALAANPISVNQMMSNYVDGALGSFLIVGALGIYSLLQGKARIGLSLTLVTIGFMGAAALKFPGLVFMLIGLVFAGHAIWSRPELQRSLKETGTRGLHLPVFAALLCGSLLINPYVLHLVDGLHIFHPAMGSQKIEGLVSQFVPRGFNELDQFSKLVQSVFSEASNAPAAGSELPPIKLPFSFTLDELERYYFVDNRFGGWGPLFSGIMVVWLWLIRKHLGNESIRKIVLLLTAMSIVSPACWWARFNPQLHTLVALSAFIILVNGRGKKREWLILATLLVANSAAVLWHTVTHLVDENRRITSMIIATQQRSIDGNVYWIRKQFAMEPIFRHLNIQYVEIELAAASGFACRAIIYEVICGKKAPQSPKSSSHGSS
jgi:hypothetical protein